MWFSTLDFGAAQLRSVTEIGPKSPLLCVNKRHIRYGFRAVAKSLRYSVNIALNYLFCHPLFSNFSVPMQLVLSLLRHQLCQIVNRALLFFQLSHHEFPPVVLLRQLAEYDIPPLLHKLSSFDSALFLLPCHPS